MKSQDIEHLKNTIQLAKDINDTDRSKLLELLNTFSGYGLVWVDKQEENENKILNGQMPVLNENLDRYIKARPSPPQIVEEKNANQTALSFESVEDVKNEDSTTEQAAPHHLLIEGDNLPALTALTYTHEGLVDVIYIDPPYNTGNKDFKYNDRFVDKEDPYRHSKWLSFMHKRLLIAKRLLKSTGVIFISIDDNEQANLKLLCDEILGENNFIASISWSGGRKNDSRFISVSHEYILVYVKSIESLKDNNVTWRERKKGIDEIYSTYKRLKKTYVKDFKSIEIGLKKWFKELPNDHEAKKQKHYSCVDEVGIFFPDNISWPGGGGPSYEVLHPVTKLPVRVPSRGWLYSKPEKMQEMIQKGLVYFGDDENFVPCLKSYLKDREFQVPYSVIYQDGRASTKRLREILGEGSFENPKDESILKNLIEFSTINIVNNRNHIILDFFAGSGTTLHAVMQLNAEDGGKRQCILVTNNENGIAEEVCYERNKRVINGYTKPNGTAVQGLTNNHLHYYQLDWFDELAAPLSQDKPNEHSSIRLARLMREMLMIKENCFEDIEAEILRGYHPDLKFKDDNHPDLDVLESADKYVVIVYTDDAIADGVRIIEQLPDAAKPVVVYPFEYQGEPDPTPFETVKERVTLKALPSSYKETYDHILQDLRKRRRRFVISDEDTVAADLTAEQTVTADLSAEPVEYQ